MAELIQIHDEENERLVLGTMLNRRGAFDEVRDILYPECFYIDKHREVYKAILSVADNGNEINIISVFAEIDNTGKVGGSIIDPAYIAELSGHEIIFDFYHLAYRLVELEKRRKILVLSHYLANYASSEHEDLETVLNRMEKTIDEILDTQRQNVYTVKECFSSVIENINANLNGSEKAAFGSSTGFPEIDGKGGFHTSDLIIIAGSTSQGKTSFANSVVLNASMNGDKIAVYSMEMTKLQLTSRLLSVHSGVSSSEILYAKLSAENLQKVDKSIGLLSKTIGENIFFDDRSTSNIDTIIGSIRSLKKREGICGAVVDYLQILNVNATGKTNKEQRMGEIARRLKNLAKDLDIWIIALSQLSRDKENPEPTIERIRDSGQIAEAADVIILIYRPEVYGKQYPDPYKAVSTKNTAMIKIIKGRNIGLFNFICGFDPPTTRFYPLSTYPQMELPQLISKKDSEIQMPF